MSMRPSRINASAIQATAQPMQLVEKKTFLEFVPVCTSEVRRRARSCGAARTGGFAVEQPSVWEKSDAVSSATTASVCSDAESDCGSSVVSSDGSDQRTTIVLKQLPPGCSQQAVCDVLLEMGLFKSCNFLYAPIFEN